MWRRLRQTGPRPMVLTLLCGLIAAIAVAAAAAGYLATASRAYTSSAFLTLSPRDASKGSADNLTLAATRYQAFLGSTAALEAVAVELRADATELADDVTVTIPPQTVTIVIAAAAAKPAHAARIANALADAAVEHARTDPVASVDLVAPAVSASAPSTPAIRMVVVGAGAVIAVVAAGTGWWAWRLRRRA